MIINSISIYGEQSLLLLQLVALDKLDQDLMERLVFACKDLPQSLQTNLLFQMFRTRLNFSEAQSKVSISQNDTNRKLCKLAKLINSTTDDSTIKIKLEIAKMKIKGKYLEKDIAGAFHICEELSNQNNSHILYLLGKCYEKGIGTEINFIKAYQNYRISADCHHKKSLFRLADLICNNKVQQRIEDEKIRYLKRAAKSGHPGAQYEIAKRCLKGIGVKLNPELARTYFESSALEGNRESAKEFAKIVVSKNSKEIFNQIGNSQTDSEAKYIIGTMYLYGNYVNINYDKASKFLKESANDSYGKSATLYGKMLYEGKGVQKNYIEAVKYFKIGFKNGDYLSAYELGNLYKDGIILKKNIELSIHYYKLGAINGEPNCSSKYKQMILQGIIHDDYQKYLKITADKGDSDAAYEYGTLLKKKNNDKNNEESLKYIKIAADNGNAKACLEMGKFYYDNKYIEEALKYFVNAADKGDAESSYILAKLYEKDNKYVEAFKYYNIAIKSNHNESLYSLGLLYEYGKGIKQDINEAITLFNESIKYGNINALVHLGKIYEEGKFIEKNEEKALKLYQLAAEKNQPQAIYEIGRIIYEGKLLPKDIKKALTQFIFASTNGIIEANYMIGKIYEIENNESLAIKYYWEGATKGNAKCSYALGKMYLKGKGVEKSIDISLKYFNNSLIQGYIHSGYAMGKIYYEQLNYNEAIKYFKLSADKGDSKSQLFYGKLLYEGDKLPKDKNDALYYLKLSERNGNENASLILGKIYENDNNMKEAFNIYKSLADKDIPEACYEAGKILFYGTGIPKDEINGIKYLEKSANSGFKEAKYLLGTIYQEGSNVVKKDSHKAIELLKSIPLTNSNAIYELAKANESIGNIDESKKYYKEAADKGHPQSSYEYGNYIYQTDKELGIKYLEFAANSSIKESCLFLAKLMSNKQYEPNNEELKQKILNISADNGDPYSCNIIGIHYYNKHDDLAAIKYLKVASDAYIGESSYYLALMMEEGRGNIELNSTKLFDLYLRAYESGITDATYHLGNLLENGIGIAQNLTLALQYYKEAADKNNEKAATRYGIMLYLGKGIEKNDDEAIKYLKISADNNNESANLLAELLDNKNEKEESEKYYKIAADLGNINSTYKYGLILKNKGNLDEALKYFEKASEKGNYNAMYEIGLILENSNPTTAGKYYRKAIEGSISEAAYRLGMLVFEGRGYPHNDTEAAQYFQIGSRLGNAQCLCMLGYQCETGKGVFRDNSEALKLYKASLSKGNIDAAYRIGLMLETGKSSNSLSLLDDNKAIKDAFEYYKIAADKGHPKAAFKLKQMLEQGKGCEKVLNLANQYLKIAADYHEMNAAFILAEMYEYGRNIPQNFELAAKYYKISADAGYSKAAYIYGRWLQIGKGVEKNDNEAIKYLYNAAKDGYIDAVYCLGCMLLDGNSSLQKNIPEALRYFEIAASKGHIESAFIAGYLYENGNEIPVNEVKAAMFYKMAADKNHKKAALQLSNMYKTGKEICPSGMSDELKVKIQWLPGAVLPVVTKCSATAEDLSNLLKFSCFNNEKVYLFHNGEVLTQSMTLESQGVHKGDVIECKIVSQVDYEERKVSLEQQSLAREMARVLDMRTEMSEPMDYVNSESNSTDSDSYHYLLESDNDLTTSNDISSEPLPIIWQNDEHENVMYKNKDITNKENPDATKGTEKNLC
ncbi:chitin synthase regulatory factor chr2 [Histomonas meleagridis]|uniref:chitin synthase regulatory factor chr2 n=1 Tax=Histomonas meleagridis TaxID=135588 RepID=UPI003559C6F6|nr:chitin synthase regulatory factor chr2 [Histomonas meleagridis]KAH0806411.1 chitin synthase regulatory factor chr2 [Histomonas meleagridis]